MRKHLNMSSAFWEDAARSRCSLIVAWSLLPADQKLEWWGERVRKQGKQADKASFANYSLPAKHGISHHTRCFISLADFNCEDPAASVDFRHLWNPPASLALQCFSWLMIQSNSSCCCPLLSWGLQVAQHRVIQYGGLKAEVLDCAYLWFVGVRVNTVCAIGDSFLLNIFLIW